MGLCLGFIFCFFFQAEDGIRDLLVTGVQTCALPIYHLSVELEFMHFLTYKESYSRCHDGVDKTEIVVDAQKKFVKNHIGRWVPLFCRMLAKKSDTGLFKLIADCMSAWMDFEVAFL